MLTFQMLLTSVGIEEKEVRLLRHSPKSGVPGMSPFSAWHRERSSFETYQATQLRKDRKFFCAPYWASFVATPARETLFVGLYAPGVLEGAVAPFDCPLTNVEHDGRSIDRYPATQVNDLSQYAGRLKIDWGLGTRSWGQHGDRNIKPITELSRDAFDQPYPGHSAFLRRLSEIESLAPSWREVLSSAQGVYLLTCPKTKEQYVGSACSVGGFISRWEQHAAMSGDAIAFRSRDPADYRVSILEVAGSLANDRDILELENRWKEKLQSREMGLNRN